MNASAVICASLLGLLLFGLGLAISATRLRSGELAYPAMKPGSLLCRLVRAHGNTSEYAPFLALLFLYLGARGPTPWQVGLIVCVTASRFLVVIGLLAWPTLSKPNAARFIGAMGTYLFGAALCIDILPWRG